jgi:hypothetical protein
MQGYVLLAALALAGGAAAELPSKDKLAGIKDKLSQNLAEYPHLVNGGGKCLDIAGNVEQGGASVQIWDCNDAPNQRWKMANGRLENIGGKCLDVSDLQRNGARVQTWDCNDAPNQQWRPQGGKLVNGGGKCLDVSELQRNGAPAQIWDCNDAPNQQWRTE